MTVQSKRSMKELLQKRMEADQIRYRRIGSLYRQDLLGVKFFKCKEGDNLVDIVTYTSGDNDPVSPNDLAFVLKIFIHRGLSQTGGDLICLEQTFGKKFRCPCCEEYRRKINIGAPEAETRPLRYQGWPRTFYNIYDRKDPGAGIQVWHTSAFLFQQYLDVICRKSVLSGQSQGIENFIPYMDPTLDGRSIAFRREGTGEKTKFIGIRFEDRVTEVPESVVKSAHALDELIFFPTFEQAYEEFWGVPYGEEEVLERSAKFVGEDDKSVEEKESAEEEEERELREKLTAIEAKKKKRTKEDSKKDEQKREVKSTNGCPYGHEFGVDIDEKPDCDKCQFWKDCANENDRLERERRK